MEPNDDKEALMRAYLLGDPPEADAQEIEELYFAADEQFVPLGGRSRPGRRVWMTLAPQERALRLRYLTPSRRVRDSRGSSLLRLDVVRPFEATDWIIAAFSACYRCLGPRRPPARRLRRRA